MVNIPPRFNFSDEIIILNLCRRKHYLCISAPAMPLPQTPPLPGPGSYEMVDYEGPTKHYMSGAAFVSTTSRWTGPAIAGAGEMPGPGESQWCFHCDHADFVQGSVVGVDLICESNVFSFWLGFGCHLFLEVLDIQRKVECELPWYCWVLMLMEIFVEWLLFSSELLWGLKLKEFGLDMTLTQGWTCSLFILIQVWYLCNVLLVDFYKNI